MGKVFKVILTILSCIVFFQQDVYAEDGSLKIDTRISESAYQKESFYIEQETELTKLFNEALAKNISEQKEKESISYKKDRALIFDGKPTKRKFRKHENYFKGEKKCF